MYTVYEIETPEGKYVGVTRQPLKTRLSQLRHRRGFNGVIRAIASFGKREDALALELELRPDYHMGLNLARGGRHQSLPSLGAANGMSKRVRIEGVEYETIRAAVKALGIKKTAIHYRLASPYFLDWEYLTPPHAQYWRAFFARKQRIPAISLALQGR